MSSSKYSNNNNKNYYASLAKKSAEVRAAEFAKFCADNDKFGILSQSVANLLKWLVLHPLTSWLTQTMLDELAACCDLLNSELFPQSYPKDYCYSHHRQTSVMKANWKVDKNNTYNPLLGNAKFSEVAEEVYLRCKALHEEGFNANIKQYVDFLEKVSAKSHSPKKAVSSALVTAPAAPAAVPAPASVPTADISTSTYASRIVGADSAIKLLLGEETEVVDETELADETVTPTPQKAPKKKHPKKQGKASVQPVVQHVQSVQSPTPSAAPALVELKKVCLSSFKVLGSFCCDPKIYEEIKTNPLSPYGTASFVLFNSEEKKLSSENLVWLKNELPSPDDNEFVLVEMNNTQYYFPNKQYADYVESLGADSFKHIVTHLRKKEDGSYVEVTVINSTA